MALYQQPTEKELQQLFNQFDKKKVLVIGDVMLDAYWFGKVDRISPEAPVPVVQIKKKENRLGGAANVALNLKSLGAMPVLCSVAGDDNEGRLFAEILKAEGMDDSGILYSNERPTTVKTRVIGNNSHLLRVDTENQDYINSNDRQALLKKIKEKMSAVDILIFQDYNKGVLDSVLISEVLNEAKRKNIDVVVDPKKQNFFSYQAVKLFKPNLKELLEGTKVDMENGFDESVLKEAITKLRKSTEAELIMVTLSERGIYISTPNKSARISAVKRDIYDVSGAGDTVVSVISLCLAAGANAFLSGAISNISGGLVCEKLGVVPVNKQDLLKESVRLLTK